MTSNATLENATTARFAVALDRYFEQGRDDVGLHFAYDRPEDEWNASGIHHQVVGLMTADTAATMRQTLFPYYRAWDFADLDKTTADYITHSMAPMEWHDKLDSRDPQYMAHVVIWAEQLPSIPPAPEPPTAAEALMSLVGLTLAAGIMGGADKVVPRQVKTDGTVADNLRAFTKVTLRELPIGSAWWTLRDNLRAIERDLRAGREKQAVFMVRQMSYSSDEAIAMWAKRCMPAVGIPA
jgi:hypothetical protein